MQSIVQRMESDTTDARNYVENIEAAMKAEHLDLQQQLAAQVSQLTVSAQVRACVCACVRVFLRVWWRVVACSHFNRVTLCPVKLSV